MIVNANALHIPLADNSVQCVVTSPPYYGLRDYQVAGQIGLEQTPDEYVSNLVAVFREVKRVLREDGVLWLNIADSYASEPYEPWGIKPKDEMDIPHYLKIVLKKDGWYSRSTIIWSKPNPMPESVKDRPTKAHEYLFLLSKSPRYYFDQDAVREPHAEASLPRALRGLSSDNKWSEGAPGSTAHTMSQPRPNVRKEWEAEHGGGGSGFNGHSGYFDANGRPLINPNGRNIRTVWTIATQPVKYSHFATFPEKLVEPCIKAGTSERGCCPKCGKPWVRIVEKSGGTIGKSWHDHNDDLERGMSQAGCSGLGSKDNGSGKYKVETTGWQPACACDAGDPVPCLVFDPFAGSGTVERVAIRLRRKSVGTELNYQYIKDIVSKRTADIQPSMV